MKKIMTVILAALLLAAGLNMTVAQDNTMSFFQTSAGPGSPWNDAHPSRGCSQENLISTGGDGLFYCFAAD